MGDVTPVTSTLGHRTTLPRKHRRHQPRLQVGVEMWSWPPLMYRIARDTWRQHNMRTCHWRPWGSGQRMSALRHRETPSTLGVDRAVVGKSTQLYEHITEGQELQWLRFSNRSACPTCDKPSTASQSELKFQGMHTCIAESLYVKECIQGQELRKDDTCQPQIFSLPKTQW